MGRDLLLIQPFVEFRHVVLRSHLPFHVTEMMKKSFFFFILFPNVPKQTEKQKREVFGVAGFAAACAWEAPLVIQKHHYKAELGCSEAKPAVGDAFKMAVIRSHGVFSFIVLTGIKCCTDQSNPRMGLVLSSENT